jgi:predicted TIM-barrel fold metal-dependent hydrolase
MINRRELLAGAAATVTLAIAARGIGLPALAAESLPPVFLDAPIIDIHCHIFNAADLPVYGFLRQAVFEIYDGQAQVSYYPPRICRQAGTTSSLGRAVREALADMLRKSMNNAVPAAKEAADLKSRFAVAAPQPTTSIADDLERYFGATPQLEAAGPPSTYLDAEQRQEIDTLIKTEGREQLAKLLLEETGDPNPADGSTAFKLRAASVADRMCTSTGIVPRHICWAKRMTASRAEHAAEIARLYDTPTARVRLFTPALVDYSRWLNDAPQSDLKSQIDAMEQVALHTIRAGRAKFHGYIAFDPLRDVQDGGRALALAQHAVRKRGFVGVKLYPPMGFKPIANASDPTLTFPKHTLRGLTASQLAFALDVRLRELYRWCADEGVPILSHAANSNGAGPCYGERADIANWLAVIAPPQNKDIRLCLAHIGSFDAARAVDGKLNPNDSVGLSRSWEWHFGRLTQHANARNVYADLSYFSELLKGDSNEIHELKQAFATFIKTFPGIIDRLIYGSDWIMLDRELKKEEHLKAVYWFLSDVFAMAAIADTKAALVKVFSTNGMKFLGLSAGDETRARLIAFYRRHNLPHAGKLLDEFAI